MPSKLCKSWKHFSSTGNYQGATFLVWIEHRGAVRKWQNAHAQLSTMRISGFLLPQSIPQMSLLRLLSVLLLVFLCPSVQKCFILVDSFYVTTWMIPIFHLCSLSLSAKAILSSCSDRNSWQGRKRIWTASAYTASTVDFRPNVLKVFYLALTVVCFVPKLLYYFIIIEVQYFGYFMAINV